MFKLFKIIMYKTIQMLISQLFIFKYALHLMNPSTSYRQSDYQVIRFYIPFYIVKRRIYDFIVQRHKIQYISRHLNNKYRKHLQMRQTCIVSGI